MDKSEILNRYSTHTMSQDQQRSSNMIRTKVQELSLLIDESLIDCREKSLALTKLEEALFFTTAGIARNSHD